MLVHLALALVAVALPRVDSGQFTSSGLWYQVRGTGAPVLLIHGANLDARSLEPLAARLARTHRVIVTDLRFHGRSRDGSGPFSFDDDVAEVLDAAGVDRATIVGHSLGASIALDLALRSPARVARLVLIAPSISGKAATRPVAGFEPVRDAALAGDWPRAGRALAATPVMRLMHDTLYQAQLATIVEENTRLFRADRSRRRAGIPAVDQLGEVGVPTLVLMGDRDPTEANDAGEILVQRVPGARGRILPGCGHILPFDCRAATAAAIVSFLADSK